MSTPLLLEAIGLTMWRGERALFEDLDVPVAAGRALHVRGPNGSGKTTLLRVLCGLLLPSEGSLRLDGEPVSPSDPRLRQLVSYLGHADGLKLELTVEENVQFGRTMSGAPPLDDPLPLLARVGLAAHAEVETRRLSAGQRRRLALARLMGCEHRVWIMDEPFTSLDRDGIRIVIELLEGALDDGVGVVFTSHQAAPLSQAVDALELGTR